MATVLVGPYGADPSTIWPEKYSSCVWNFTTGWTCQTVAPSGGSSPPIATGSPAPSSSPPNLAIMASGGSSKGCGCCGGAAASVTAPMLAQIQTTNGTSITAKPCCGGCAGKGDPKWLAILTAVVLALLAVAALSDG